MSIIDYVFGDNGRAGIAAISGDAGGFNGVLDESEIISIVEVYIDGDEEFKNAGWGDDMREQLKRHSSKLHALHVDIFGSDTTSDD